MERLLPALEETPPAYLVGGAVRDLLLGAGSVDLDVAVEGDARAAAREIAARLGGSATEHERFGTATVTADELRVDLAGTRRERYERPGALPEVEPALLDEDLARRDFTVNALAAGLSGNELGELRDPHRGLDDLEGATIRVLHPASFVDDPTRLLRAVRYEARLGFAMDPQTEALAREAAAAGALGTVSGPRVRDELLDLLAEAERGIAVARLAELGLDAALHPSLRADSELVASASLGAADTGADPALAGLAALVHAAPDRLVPWLDHLNMPKVERDAVARAASEADDVVRALSTEPSPAELHTLLSREPPEGLALALGLGAPGEPVLRYLADLRDVRLEVTGDDLVAAGVPESPALGRALEETLRRKLNGEVSGREEELRLALRLAEDKR